MSRQAMVMDTRKCVGCSACVLACQAENAVPEGHARCWVEQETRGRFPDLTARVRSLRCHHCDDPPCERTCPTGATFIGEGGLVLVDPSRCTGCKACVAACPYDARYVHPDGHVDKCSGCVHRLHEGRQPACVEVCPTRSLAVGDLDDHTSDVSRLLATRDWEVEHPAAGTLPNLFFLA